MRIVWTAVILSIASLADSPASFADDFDSDGVKIHYQVDGDGPPVVLVHGYLATGDLNWRTNGVVKMLSPKYKVITIDNRGHGKSDKPLESQDYGEKMVEDVVRLLDHLKIEKAHIVGYSMGGMIALKMSATHPDRMLSAVVGGMGWFPKGPIGDRPAPPNLPPAFKPKRACAEAFPDLGITRDEMTAVKVPMTVIIGEVDNLIRRVESLESIRPDIPVVRIPGANHVTCIWNEKFKSAIQFALDRPPTSH